MVLVSGTHRYSERPLPSVRKLLPPLACTSTVGDALPPAAGDAGEVGDAGEAGDDGEAAGVDGELLEPPELQAAARIAAAASGPPIRIANEALLDESRLFICCAGPSRWNTECLVQMPSNSQYATAATSVRRMRYATHHQVIPDRTGIREGTRRVASIT
jgi:hypothetical protein